MKSIQMMYRFMKGEEWSYVLGLLLLIIINLLFLWVPKLIGHAIDTLGNGKVGLLGYIGYFFGLMIIITILKFWSRRKLLGSIRKMEFGFRRALCSKALQIKTTYYEKNGPGKVMALMTNDVTSLRVALGLGMMIVVDVIFFTIIGSVVLINEMDTLLAAKIMTPMVLILSIVFGLGQIMRRKQREAQTTYSDLTEFVQELFQGVSIIRAFNKEVSVESRFGLINEENYNKNMTVAQYDSFLSPLTMTAPLICMSIGMYICGQLVTKDMMTVGQFVSINSYIMMIVAPLMALGALASITQKGLASADRIREFMELPEESETTETELIPLAPIELQHLHFTYEGSKSPALVDVSTTIQPGEFVGIVGKPGSGKSTIFKLLLQLQPAERDSLFIAGHDVMDLDLGQLRRSIAYVPSNSYLLSSSIADNITFGSDTLPHVSVREAATRADLYRDLGAQLDDPLKILKEDGKDLSGGQKQRINIARGFYKNASYLLLDDCFSALDPITVTNVLTSLRGVKEQTILCISQRLEVTKQADRILVVDEGKLVEEGTHDTLMALNGLYAELYTAQEGAQA